MKRYLILMLPLALAACAKTPQQVNPLRRQLAAPAATQPAPADTAALSAYHWQLNEATDANGKRIDALFVNADKPLQLDFADGRVTVGNACNHMGGAYSVAGDKLKFDRLASTLMACTDAKLMALDQEIGKRLEAELTFALQSGDAPTLTHRRQRRRTDVQRRAHRRNPLRRPRRNRLPRSRCADQTLQPSADPEHAMPAGARDSSTTTRASRPGVDGAFENFYDSIEGYTHQPGIRNVVRVKRYTIKNPPADGSSLAYELDMVVESETIKP